MILFRTISEKVNALAEYDVVHFAHAMARDTSDAIRLYACNNQVLARNITQMWENILNEIENTTPGLPPLDSEISPPWPDVPLQVLIGVALSKKKKKKFLFVFLCSFL